MAVDFQSDRSNCANAPSMKEQQYAVPAFATRFLHWTTFLTVTMAVAVTAPACFVFHSSEEHLQLPMWSSPAENETCLTVLCCHSSSAMNEDSLGIVETRSRQLCRPIRPDRKSRQMPIGVSHLGMPGSQSTPPTNTSAATGKVIACAIASRASHISESIERLTAEPAPDKCRRRPIRYFRPPEATASLNSQ